jgi:hypothetical protein
MPTIRSKPGNTIFWLNTITSTPRSARNHPNALVQAGFMVTREVANNHGEWRRAEAEMRTETLDRRPLHRARSALAWSSHALPSWLSEEVSSHLLQEFLCQWKARSRANDGIDAAARTTGGRTAIPLGNPVPDFRRWEGFPAVETPANVADHDLLTVGWRMTMRRFKDRAGLSGVVHGRSAAEQY